MQLKVDELTVNTSTVYAEISSLFFCYDNVGNTMPQPPNHFKWLFHETIQSCWQTPEKNKPENMHSWTTVSLFEVLWVIFQHEGGSKVFMCTCQSRLPQQVALTEFRNQVNAQVKVIVVTFWGSLMRMYFPINEREDSEISNTTPTNSTYCSEKSSLCFY